MKTDHPIYLFLSAGPEAFRARMHGYFPREHRAIDGYLSLIHSTARRAQPYFAERLLPRPLAATHGTALRYPLLQRNRSTAEVLSELTDNPRLRAVLADGDVADLRRGRERADGRHFRVATDAWGNVIPALARRATFGAGTSWPVHEVGRNADYFDLNSARLLEAVRTTLYDWIVRLRQAAGGEFPEGVTAFRPEMAVHGRYEQPCPDCGAPVQRIRHADNETNYCAKCQTGGKLLADRALSRLLRADWPRTLEEMEERRGLAPQSKMGRPTRRGHP
jgi:hypothetical protein